MAAWSSLHKSRLEIEERIESLSANFQHVVDDPENRFKSLYIDLETGEFCLEGNDVPKWYMSRPHYRVGSITIGFPSDLELTARWLVRRLTNKEAKALLSQSGSDVGDANWRRLVSFRRSGDAFWKFSSPPETWQAMMGKAGVALVRKVRTDEGVKRVVVDDVLLMEN